MWVPTGFDALFVVGLCDVSWIFCFVNVVNNI